MPDPVALALAAGDLAAIDDATPSAAGALVIDWRHDARAVAADVAAIARELGVEIDGGGPGRDVGPALDRLPAWNAALGAAPSSGCCVRRSTATRASC